jgi:cytochrome oxidase assembly protein ShyY1
MVGDHHEEEGEVSLVGVLRRGEEKGGFSPDNDIKARHFFWLDHAGIAKAMGYNEEDLPVIMDVIKPKDESSEVTLMNPLKKKIENYIEFYMTPEKHAGYAATWYVFYECEDVLTRGNKTNIYILQLRRFSFSIASAIMMYIRFRRTKKVTKTY